MVENVLDRLADGPYLNSRTIYDFDLDTQILTIEDFDCILPSQDMSLPRGTYYLKKINKNADRNQDGRVHHLDTNWTTLDEAAAQGELEKDAFLQFEDGQVELIVSGTNVLCSSKRPVLLRLKYTVRLTGPGTDLIYAGAVQPSDYTAFNKQFGALVPSSRISKQIVVTSRSKHMYYSLYFNGSDPLAFPQSQEPIWDEKGEFFSHRWALPVAPGNVLRAFYFAVTMKVQAIHSPQPNEVLDQS